MGPRRAARELALQVLYQMDVQTELSVDQAQALVWQSFEAELELPEANRAEIEVFALRLVRGTRAEQPRIDDLIKTASRNWRPERMARVDRNLLRLGVFELMSPQDVPARVAINEAIEIAKRFGTNESPAFINGILDRCLEELNQAKAPS